MPRKKIREYDVKLLLYNNIEHYLKHNGLHFNSVQVSPETNLDELPSKYPWLGKNKLVVKPDQLFGKKGKNNLVLLKAGFEDVKKFIRKHMNKEVEIRGTKGVLTHFIIEPFIEHDDEYYLSILSQRDEDVVMFSTKGGVDVEDHWNKVIHISVPTLDSVDNVDIQSELGGVPKEKREKVEKFIKAIFNFFRDFDFVYLEMNPIAFDSNGEIIPLGLVSEIDDCAAFKNMEKWNGLEFPQPFGKPLSEEEKFISRLDANSGASLKFTSLNPNGRIWLLVAGGGASVIYTDTVVDLGYGKELGNYGEYSGDPNEEETYQYADTVLKLATANTNGHKKALLVGGGVANFTDVAKTFKGIIRALRENRDKLKKANMKIYVRRGGPNYQEGLKLIKAVGEELGIPMEVFGPDTHMTKIVSMAVKDLN